ncbi:ecdysteroid 22-kinase family protein [Streptomyces sp. GQFP]|uniref:ecdysteroid 22-kinase family protein n=1 Tax=Streptomyces sp. GQFP TaxID=2907545 RepID=UPI001F48EC09|nr:ecdysteroid 22-kinase family protein [Streptomyces sp. GQFP]UIX31969.1 ecdysteroid 22-kinase family protein [Streptomyces sp. GQFP]
MLDLTTGLPMSVEAIDAAWLGAALTSGLGETVRVDDLRVTHIVWGNATKVCVEATYGRAPASLPARLCVKGGFDDRVAEVGSPAQLVLEAEFYGTVRSHLTARLPRSFYAAGSPSGDQGIVILEDLTTRGVRFVDAGQTLGPDEVASGLEAQAAWHASTWGSVPGSIPGVRVGGADRRGARLFFNEKYWARHFAEEGAPKLPAGLDDRERVRDGFRALWAYDDAGVHSLQHGDAHPGNTYVEADGTVVFLDWAAYFWGHWAYDVALFLTGSLETDDRRRQEEGLLRHYLDALATNGGPALPFADAWREYGRHQLRGLLWAVSPSVMQPFERSRPMCDRHAAAVEDHGTLALLGV